MDNPFNELVDKTAFEAQVTTTLTEINDVLSNGGLSDIAERNITAIRNVYVRSVAVYRAVFDICDMITENGGKCSSKAGLDRYQTTMDIVKDGDAYIKDLSVDSDIDIETLERIWNPIKDLAVLGLEVVEEDDEQPRV